MYLKKEKDIIGNAFIINNEHFVLLDRSKLKR